MDIPEPLKRSMPRFARNWLVRLRNKLSTWPSPEELVLHDYELRADPNTRARLSLVIPSISPDKAFGGVVTGIKIFLEIGKKTGAELRILLDDLHSQRES